MTDDVKNKMTFAEAPWNGKLTKVTINFDGACEPNPGGWMIYAWVMVDQDGVKFNEYAESKPPAPGNTNNVAEWLALGTALKTVAEAQTDPAVELLIRGDSQLVIHQLSGRWQCNRPIFGTLRDRCLKLLDGRKWSAQWVPREQNQAPDALGRAKYLEVVGKPMPEHAERRQAV